MRPRVTAVVKRVHSAETSATLQCCLQAHTQRQLGHTALRGRSHRAMTDDQPLSGRYAACSCHKQNKVLTISIFTAVFKVVAAEMLGHEVATPNV